MADEIKKPLRDLLLPKTTSLRPRSIFDTSFTYEQALASKEPDVGASLPLQSAPASGTSIKETKTLACIPCVPPDSLIITNPSIKTISDISDKAKVLDSKGMYTAVISIMKRQYKGDLITIYTKYQNIPISLTPEHPVLAIKAVPCPLHKGYCIPGKVHRICDICSMKQKYQPEFVPAGELFETKWKSNYTEKKEFLLIPRLIKTEDINEIQLSNILDDISVQIIGDVVKPFTITKEYYHEDYTRKNKQHVKRHSVRSYKMIKGLSVRNKILIDKNFMKLIGFYLAEGHVSFTERGSRICFSFGKHEKEYIEEVVQLLQKVFGVKATIEEKKTATAVRVCSSILASFFNQLFGKGAKNKKIPLWMLTLPEEKQNYLIEGYFRGDGYKNKKKNVLAIATVSKQLAFSLRLLLFRLGIIHGLYLYKNNESIIEGRKIKSDSDKYIISIGGTSALNFINIVNYQAVPSDFKVSPMAGIDRNYIYVPIKKIERKQYDGLVMNLQTESNTYTVNGIVVHNCVKNHMSAVAGILAESKRFIGGGIKDPKIVEAINIATKEVTAAERGDLDPAKIASLPTKEKEVAEWATDQLRGLRHSIDGIKDKESLEEAIVKADQINNEMISKFIDLLAS